MTEKLVPFPATPPEPKRRNSLNVEVRRIIQDNWTNPELMSRLQTVKDEDSESGSWRDDYAVAASVIKRLGTEAGNPTIIAAKEREIRNTFNYVLESLSISRKERLLLLEGSKPSEEAAG
jgi:hypothetical protein